MIGQACEIFPGCCLQVSRKVDALSRCENNQMKNALPEAKEQGINFSSPQQTFSLYVMV